MKKPLDPILLALISEYDRVKAYFVRNWRMEHLAADDLVQQVYLRILNNKNLAIVKDPRRFILYLARLVAKSEIPSRKRARANENLADEIPACLETDAGRIDSLSQTEDLDELHRIVNELGPDLTLVVGQRFFEGLTIAEISTRNEMTRDAVRHKLGQAIIALQKYYEVGIPKPPAQHQQQRKAP